PSAPRRQRSDDESALARPRRGGAAGVAAGEASLEKDNREMPPPREPRDPAAHTVRASFRGLWRDDDGVGLDLGALDVLDVPDRSNRVLTRKRQLAGADDRDSSSHGLHRGASARVMLR